MHTLFGENILSPALESATQPNPFEHSFTFPPSNSTSRSSRDSPINVLPLIRDLQELHSKDLITHTDHATEGQSSVRRRGYPKLLFMGHRRSGKSSIQKLIFHKLAPADTLFLEPTNSITTATVQSFVPISSAELPSHIRVPPLENNTGVDIPAIFTDIGAVVWVLDIQDEYQASIQALIQLAVYLADNYPGVNLEVFIHKIDGLSEEYKYDTFREVRQQFQDEVSDLGYAPRISVSYYQTSIFDHSIFEAMSKVVQKLLPQLPAMEALLNKLCSTCRIQKAYLFDTTTKIYLATDASPTFLRDYEVCSDYVDVIVDLKQIYGTWRRPKKDGKAVDEEKNKAGQNTNTDISESVVTFRQTGETYIYAREISERLSLLCVMGKGSTPDKKATIDYNVDIVHDAMLQIFKI